MIPIKSASLLLLSSFLALSVQASFDAAHDTVGHLQHNRHFQHRRAPGSPDFRSSSSKVTSSRKRESRKKCRARDGEASSDAAPTSASVSASADPAQPTTAKISQANAVQGLINVPSECGDIGATPDISALSGPNGNIEWLNCGINDGGWRPPFIKIEDLITADLGQALQSGNSPFSQCSAFIDQFYRYGQQFNIPPIMLASFALQESSCNPGTVGGAGEQGLMQITQEKCAGAPGGNCQDPDFNIQTGAKYFSDSLAANNGNVLLTIGQYNGWHEGLTFADATAAANGGNCRAQNNLDYLQQFLNGWLQNIDAYTISPPLGKYFNLNVCP